MHQTKKGNQYCFGAKAHIGAEAESGLVNSVVVTAINVAVLRWSKNVLNMEAAKSSGR